MTISSTFPHWIQSSQSGKRAQKGRSGDGWHWLVKDTGDRSRKFGVRCFHRTGLTGAGLGALSGWHCHSASEGGLKTFGESSKTWNSQSSASLLPEGSDSPGELRHLSLSGPGAQGLLYSWQTSLASTLFWLDGCYSVLVLYSAKIWATRMVQTHWCVCACVCVRNALLFLSYEGAHDIHMIYCLGC